MRKETRGVRSDRFEQMRHPAKSGVAHRFGPCIEMGCVAVWGDLDTRQMAGLVA